MRHPRLANSIAVIACCLIAGTLLWATRGSYSSETTASQSSSPAVSKYTNDRYGYSVTIPDGYRLATDIMAASNPTATPSTADFVVITDLPSTEEEAVAEQIRKLDPQSELTSMDAIITGNEFVISPATTDLGWNFATRFTAIDVPGTSIPIVQHLTSDTLEDGNGAISYSLTAIDNPSIRLETVFIPNSLSQERAGATPTVITGFLIQSIDDPSFDEAAFTQLYKSFYL